MSSMALYKHNLFYLETFITINDQMTHGSSKSALFLFSTAPAIFKVTVALRQYPCITDL